MALMANLLISLIVSIFVLIDCWMMIYGWKNIEMAKASTKWPQVVGAVVRSEIVIQSDSDGVTYKPLVEYTYTVRSQTYTGQTIYFGDGSSTSIRSYSEGYVNKYPVSRKVTVFYNPADTNMSVLEPGLQKRSFILLVMGVGFTFIGI